MAQQYFVVSHSSNEQLSLPSVIAFHTSNAMNEFTMNEVEHTIDTNNTSKSQEEDLTVH